MRNARIILVTGSDTGVGKTVLTAAFTRHLRAAGFHACAVKPFCSGGRDDARLLRAAQDNELALDELNPWHFRAPLTPLLAARREGKAVALEEVLDWLRARARLCDVLLVEGAGGLLSPLGEGFDASDLLRHTRAVPLVVSPNRLGVIHQVRATVGAVPHASRRRALVVLRGTGKRDLSCRSNAAMLSECLGPGRLVEFPFLRRTERPSGPTRAALAWLQLKTCNSRSP